MGRALGAGGNLPQAALDLVGVVFAQRELGLGAQARERRFHLMRGIGNEAFLLPDRMPEAREQIIESRHQRRNLLGRFVFVDRAQIIGLALAQLLLEVLERLDAARQPGPDQNDRDRQDDELRQDHALDDFVGELRTLFERLGHLNQGRGVAGLVFVFAFEFDVQIGHAHIGAVHDLGAVAHGAHRARIGLGRQRQFMVAREEIAAHAPDLVVNMVGIVGTQEVARRQGQHKIDPVGRLMNLLRQHAHRGFERAVERRIGNRLRHQIGRCDRHRPDQQQRREHPVENLAEQRALRARPFIGVAQQIGDGFRRRCRARIRVGHPACRCVAVLPSPSGSTHFSRQ